MSPRQVIAQPQDESDSYSHGMQDLGGVQDYTIMRDREPHRNTPPMRYGFEDLTTYAFLTSSGDPSTFREVVSS